MDSTFDVKVYKILTYKGARKTTHTVRWVVAGRRWREPFDTAALADSFRSELITATRRGEAFDRETGRPVSHESGAGSASWYDFAVQFADAQWLRTAGNSGRTRRRP